MFGYLYYDEQLPKQLEQVIPFDLDNGIIWPIPTDHPAPIVAILPASVTNMSRKQRYWTSKAAMTEAIGIESLQYAPGVPKSWDTDAEHQLTQILAHSDHLSDEGTEKITIPVSVWDNFSEQAFSQLGYLSIHLSDEGVELITLNPAASDLVMDDFSEHSFTQPGYLSIHLSDEGVEKITVPSLAWNDDREPLANINYIDYIIDEAVEKITVINVLDDFSENSIPQFGYYKDHLSDENIEKITLSKGVADIWDSDAWNQLLHLGWKLSPEEIRQVEGQFQTYLRIILGGGAVALAILATALANTEASPTGKVDPSTDPNGNMLNSNQRK